MNTNKTVTPIAAPSPKLVRFVLNDPKLQNEDIATMLGNDVTTQGGMFRQKYETEPVGYRPDPHILSLAEHKEGLIRRVLKFARQYFGDSSQPYSVASSTPPAPRQGTAELLQIGKAWLGDGKKE